MTALKDIKGAVEAAQQEWVRSAGRLPRRLKIIVGHSAERGIMAETRQALPLVIEGVPVERTNEFPGWAIELL